MSVSETSYAFRIELPQWLERGRAQTVKLGAYRDGGLVAPDNTVVATYSLYDANNVAIVDAQACTFAGSMVTYDIAAATLPATLALGEGWREEWYVGMPDGTTRTVRRPAGLVLRVLYPVVTFADLVRRHSDLASMLPDADLGAQRYLDESWVTLVNWIDGKGSRPYLVMEPQALRECHLSLTLAYVYEDAMTSMGDGKYERLALKYEQRVRESWDRLSFSYDYDQDGVEDDSSARRAAQSVIYTSRPPSWS